MSEKEEEAVEAENTTLLPDPEIITFLKEGDAAPWIFKYTLLFSIPLCVLYIFLAFFVPENSYMVYQWLQWAYPDQLGFERWINNLLVVDIRDRYNRLMLIVYLSLYFAMWWVYFRSKKSEQHTLGVEPDSRRVRTLRRLLGYTSVQWETGSNKNLNDQLIRVYRAKGNAGMQVLAILIAVALLIFDRIGAIWDAEAHLSLWQHALLWLGMLTAAIAFVSFTLCVDAFDTMFNRFRSDRLRNDLIHYFNRFTINPRYIATASLLLSMILLLAYYSEMLAALTIAVIVVFGYRFWFPDIGGEMDSVDIEVATSWCSRHAKKLALLMLLTPFAWQIIVTLLVLYA